MKSEYSFKFLSELKAGDIFTLELKPKGTKHYVFLKQEKGMVIARRGENIEQFLLSERVIKINKTSEI